jgi:hypothetical protein
VAVADRKRRPHSLALQHFPAVLPELNTRRIDRV